MVGINIILKPNPKQSTVPATKKKTNSIPDETWTVWRSLTGACSSMGFPRGHRLLQTSTYYGMGVLHGLQVDLCTPVNLCGLQEHNCFTMGYRGISTLAPGTPPPPPSSLTLVSA
ncbi:hypothetical protein BTVI_145469 [Pitangus sulphuratus]|nr:hypothetical protein BTVI_145469 [Pitangus sulphuratus]